MPEPGCARLNHSLGGGQNLWDHTMTFGSSIEAELCLSGQVSLSHHLTSKKLREIAPPLLSSLFHSLPLL